MCGIVGAAARRDIVPVLIEGLRRLEYRGYDSCGVAAASTRARSIWCSTVSRVNDLAAKAKEHARRHRHRAHALGDARRAADRERAPASSRAARSRWSTTASSRTTTSCAPSCRRKGYRFESQTDTEVIAHLVHSLYAGRPARRGAARREAAGRRLRHRGGREERARHAWSARAPAARWSSASARREFPRLRRAGARRHHRPHRLPRGRRRRRHRPATAGAWSMRDGRAVDARGAHRQDQRRGGRARAVPAFHAEGDLRAAARGGRHAGERRRRSAPELFGAEADADARRHRARC